jgi:hypothetical protein
VAAPILSVIVCVCVCLRKRKKKILGARARASDDRLTRSRESRRIVREVASVGQCNARKETGDCRGGLAALKRLASWQTMPSSFKAAERAAAVHRHTGIWSLSVRKNWIGLADHHKWSCYQTDRLGFRPWLPLGRHFQAPLFEFSREEPPRLPLSFQEFRPRLCPSGRR